MRLSWLSTSATFEKEKSINYKTNLVSTPSSKSNIRHFKSCQRFTSPNCKSSTADGEDDCESLELKLNMSRFLQLQYYEINWLRTELMCDLSFVCLCCYLTFWKSFLVNDFLDVFAAAKPDWARIRLRCKKSRVSLTLPTASTPRLWHLDVKSFSAVINDHMMIKLMDDEASKSEMYSFAPPGNQRGSWMTRWNVQMLKCLPVHNLCTLANHL